MQPIPFDISESITNILTSEDNPDIKTLQASSQTCKLAAELCLKHISSFISINGSKDTVRFYELIKVNPDIPVYIRRLRYLLNNHINEREPQLFEVLRKRCRSLYSINPIVCGPFSHTSSLNHI
jgi:hypothetical protein